MHLRDQQDRERQVSPLKIPGKAIVIDSSNMTVIDVIEVMMNFINKYNKLKS
jgi:cytidylate kinase